VFWVKFKVIESVAQSQLMNQVNPHIWIQQTVKDHQRPQGKSRWHVKKDLQFVSCTQLFSCHKLLISLYDYLYRWNDCSVLYLPHWTGCLLESQSPSSNKIVNLEPAKPLMNQGWSHLCWYMMHYINYHYVRDAKHGCWLLVFYVCIKKGARDARFSLSVDVGLKPWRFAPPCRKGRWWGDQFYPFSQLKGLPLMVSNRRNHG